MLTMTSQQLDLALRWTVGVLLVAVLAITGFFAYTVYADRQIAIATLPSYRIIKAMSSQVRQKPNDAYLRVRLGEAYAAGGQPKKAIEQFNAALKIDPKHAGAYLDLGLLADINDHQADAIKYFKKVVAMTDKGAMAGVDSRRETALYQLGRIALDEKRYEDSVGYLKEALRIRKDASDTYLLLTRALVGLDQPDEAVEYVEYALAFDPNFVEANVEAARLYLDQEDYVKASARVRSALAANPESVEAQELLKKLGEGDRWYQQASTLLETDPDAAFDAIQTARNIDPTSVKYAIMHAKVLEKMKKATGALAVYNEAAKLDPSNTQVKAAISRLEAAAKKKKQ